MAELKRLRALPFGTSLQEMKQRSDHRQIAKLKVEVSLWAVKYQEEDLFISKRLVDIHVPAT